MIISFDVGIKNLAFCLFSDTSKKYNIHEWEVLNLCGDIVKCKKITKKGICDKTASYTADGQNYCGTHVKSCGMNLAPDLYYKIYSKKRSSAANRSEFAELLEYNDPKDTLGMCKKCREIYAVKIPKAQGASDIDLVKVGSAICDKLPAIINIDSIKTVIIENQISKIATRMKTVQGMIAQFFIDRNIRDIYFVSSSNKLKAYDVPKKTYAERKKSCISVTSSFFENYPSLEKWKYKFDNHKKKDDLADAFLQGVWFLNTL